MDEVHLDYKRLSRGRCGGLALCGLGRAARSGLSPDCAGPANRPSMA